MPDDTLAPRRQPHHNPDMETRVAKLEADVAEIKEILRRLEPAIGRIFSEMAEFRKDMAEFRKDMAKTREDMARLDGRVSQLPTTWTLLVGVVGIIGFVFALIRLT